MKGFFYAVYLGGLTGLLPTEGLGAVNLTPALQTEEGDGVVSEYYQFSDGPTHICYRPFDFWHVNHAGTDKLILQKEGLQSATVTIRAVEKGFPTTDVGLLAMVMTLVPDEAKVTTVPEAPSHPIRLAKAQAWEYRVSYQLFGKDVTCSTLFLTYSHCQYRFITLAPSAVFDGFYNELIGSLYSWYWEDEKHLKPVTITEDKESASENQ